MDEPNIPPEDKLVGDRLFNSPIPMRLEPRSGARYPGFCPAYTPQAETNAREPINDSEYQERFDKLSDIPPSQRRSDGG